MRRIGDRIRLPWLFLPLLLLAAGQTLAQDVTVEATVSETKIFNGERVRLTVSVSGNFNSVNRPQVPNIDGLRLLSNTPSLNRQISVVNGRTSTRYEYIYYLVAQSEGQFRVPAITLEVDGQSYKSEPISVTILSRDSEEARQSGSTRPEIFLELEVSDTTPVTGQQLITDVILYFKSGLEVNSYQPVPGWKAEGFWKEELENNGRPRAESVILDGVRYKKAQLLQFALFPTKKGELTISPYEIIVTVRSTSSRGGGMSSFFGSFGANQKRVELETDPKTLQVGELPELTGATYTGAVGSFSIERSLNTQTAYVGESIEISTNISGTGNIPLISKPEYNLPDGLEIYDPQESSSVNRQNQQISGSKTFSDILIARTPGRYTIPEARLAYFNPVQNRYLTRTLPALTFTVERDPNAVNATTPSADFELTPVTGLANWTVPRSPDLLRQWWLWAGLLIPMIFIGVAYWQKTYREKMRSDRSFARSRRAFDKAGERLEKALTHSEQDRTKEAYSFLHKALTGFIGDKLGLPEAGLSDRHYLEALNKQQIHPELINNVRMLLDKCTTISYAPETSHEYLKSHVGLAQSILEKLRKEI